MSYVSITSFSVLVNVSPKCHITPTSGLGQGDLLSPYFFLLCTKGLMSLLENSMRKNRIQGIKIYRGASLVNHLLFTNDSIIFYKVDLVNNRKIKMVLEIYGKASGQMINQTSMVFSLNISDSLQAELSTLWNSSTTLQYDKYLGLPPLIGKAKNRTFLDITSRVWRKLQIQNEQLLFQRGKEVLLKGVTLYITTYAMRYFKLPNTPCDELKVLIARFW